MKSEKIINQSLAIGQWSKQLWKLCIQSKDHVDFEMYIYIVVSDYTV